MSLVKDQLKALGVETLGVVATEPDNRPYRAMEDNVIQPKMLSALRGLPRNCFSWAALPSEDIPRELRMSVRQLLLAAAAVATLSSAQAAEPLTSAPAPAIKAPQQGMAVFSSDPHVRLL